MRFQGYLSKQGRWWLAEVPMFDAASQGRTRAEALEMIADWFVSMVNQEGFEAEIRGPKAGEFEVAANDSRAMISLLLRRQRQQSGLTLAQAAERLDSKSRNAYARYEQGVSAPTVEKLEELLRAIAPGRDLVLRQSAAA